MAITPEEITQKYLAKKSGQSLQTTDTSTQDILALAQKRKEERLKNQPKEPEKKGFIDKYVKPVGDFFTGGFGETLGQSIVAPQIAEDIKQNEAQQAQMSQQLREKLRAKSLEEQKAGLERLQRIEGTGNVKIGEKGQLSDILPATELTNAQVFGQGAITAGTILGAGSYGEGALAAKSFNLLSGSVPNIANIGAKGLGLEGAILGGIGGASQQLAAGGGLKDVTKGALTGGLTGGALGAALGGISSKLSKTKIAPFAKQTDEEVINATKKLGLTPIASQVSQSPFVATIEGSAAKGLGGTKLIERVTQFEDEANKIADKFAKKATTTTDLQQIGQDILSQKDKFTKDLVSIKNHVYKQVPFDELKNVRYRPQETINEIKKIVDKKSQAGAFASGKNFFESILNDLTSGTEGGMRGTTSGLEVRAKLQELGRKIKNWQDPIVSGNKGDLRRLYAVMSGEFDQVLTSQNKELGQLLKIANKTYSKTLELLNAPYIKTINKYANDPAKLADIILSPKTSISQIDDVFEFLGEKNANNVRGNLLEKIFSNARNKDEIFTPGGIKRQMDKFGEERLNKIFSKEQVDFLKDLSTATNSLGKIKKITDGSQTSFILRTIGQFGLFFSHPILAIGNILGDISLGNFLATNKGQELLTTGIENPQILQRAAQAIQKAGQASRYVPGVIQSQSREKR